MRIRASGSRANTAARADGPKTRGDYRNLRYPRCRRPIRVAPGWALPGAEWSWGRDHRAVQSRTSLRGPRPEDITKVVKLSPQPTQKSERMANFHRMKLKRPRNLA